jgi:hypothetical protein
MADFLSDDIVNDRFLLKYDLYLVIFSVLYFRFVFVDTLMIALLIIIHGDDAYLLCIVYILLCFYRIIDIMILIG